MSALVSVVIPSFQSAQWVSEAVESALAQSHEPCEVIVVDDGSTDGTAELLLASFGAAIHVLRQPNRGLAAARNAGLAHARGEYVQFLDADDLLLPQKIETQVEALDAGRDYDVAFCDFAWLDGGSVSESGMRAPALPGGAALHALLRRNFIVCHAALARTEAVRRAGGFDERLTACEDYDLWLRLAAAGRRFLYTPGRLVLYRRTAGSMSAQAERQFVATARVLAKAGALEPARSAEARRIVRRHLAGVHSMIARIRAADALRLALRGRVRTAASRGADAVASIRDSLRSLVAGPGGNS